MLLQRLQQVCKVMVDGIIIMLKFFYVGNGQNDKGNSVSDVVDEKPLIKPKHPLSVATFDYLSKTEEELSFLKGELLYVINTDDNDWWLAIGIHLMMKANNHVFGPLESVQVNG